MKKRGLWIFFIFLILSVAFVSAASSNLTGVDKAYQCLSNKINNSCSSLTTEEKTFSLWATGQCQQQLLSDSRSSGQCWPKSGCLIKTTAQAILALHNSGADTTGAQNWLSSENTTTINLIWYLEIESPNVTSCTIKYSGLSYTVNINQNKQLDAGAGGCLSLSQNGYFLQVSPSCYNHDFQISCNNNFLTTTLFQKSTGSTIYITDKTSSASSGGTTTENVHSSCLSTGNSCDYEGTLWGALALNTLGQDASSYLPYLITMADENQQFLPDAFLYAITAKPQYETSLLSLQQSNQYWSKSGNKYYDTALALYPLQPETQAQKTNAQNWLLSTQDSSGCWNSGNIRDTGFILASVWPRQFSTGGGGGGLPDCQTAGYFCTLKSACSQVNTLSNYQCSSSSVCCTMQAPTQTCSQLGGVLCSSNQQCGGGGTQQSSADSTSSSICCVQGACIPNTPSNSNNPGSPNPNNPSVSDCESNGGTCRAGGCATAEQPTTNYQCPISDDTCCIPAGGSGNKGSLWIWILIILIILVALGIIFRNKLRTIFKGGKPATKPGSQPPRGPPFPYYPRPFQRPPERRILIPQQRSQPVRRPASKSQSELDEVLRKLKEMGK